MMIKGKQAGFTLIELIIAIAVLLVAATAIVPLFIYTIEGAQTNNRREIAAQIANNKIEEIRAMDFSDIGIEGGTPPGVLKEVSKEIIDGLNYSVHLSITWTQKENICDLDLAEAPLWDYKELRVRVETKSPRGMPIAEEMETLIARSAFQEPSPSSGIKICAIRSVGWSEKNTPVSGVKIIIQGPGDSRSQQWTTTNNFGAALFFLENLKQSESYQVTAEAPQGMMVIPSFASKEPLLVEKDRWSSKRVQVEYPSYINFSLKDALTKEELNLSGKIKVTSHFNKKQEGIIFNSSPIAKEVIGPLWPLGGKEVGAYSLFLGGFSNYYDLKDDSSFVFTAKGEKWDGTFSAPGEVLSLTAYLLPIPPTPLNIPRATEWNWLNKDGNINPNPRENMAKREDGSLEKILWKTETEGRSISFFGNNQRGEFTADEMYWERTLEISRGNKLTLTGSLFKFTKKINLTGSGRNQGVLILKLPKGAGIDGSEIGEGEKGKKYGILHLVEGIYEGNAKEPSIDKGPYYFFDGLTLPDEQDLLIPFKYLD